MSKINNPSPIWLDGRGQLLDAGFIYIGEPNKDPIAFPIATFFDKARTIPAPQPLRTLSGVIVNGQNAAFVFVAENDWSTLVKDADSVTVGAGYIVSTQESSAETGQPLDSDLTAIAELSTTPFGRSLLTLTGPAELKAATGIPAALAITGGSISGNIVRITAGAHIYHNDPLLLSGRIFLTTTGSADPTSVAGDIWFTR